MNTNKPKEKETVISYLMRLINRPSFKRISVNQLKNNLKMIDKNVDLDAVIAKANRCLINCELIKTKIPHDKRQYFVLRRIVDSIEKEPFIPNDNLVKQRKIEFQNPNVVLGVREYTKPEHIEQQTNIKQPQIGIHSALVDKEKNIQKLNADNYDEILKKLKKGVLTYKISKLSKAEHHIVLVKFYEASETNHSFTVFKQSYLNFLNDTLLQDNIYNRRIFEFLKNEIKKQ